MTLADLEAVYRRWYELPRDIEVVHVTLAGVAANLADGDLFWLLLVAPPGSMKTEIIRSLSGCDFTYPLSSLTPQTFASGFQTKGDEPSLLMRLDQKIVTLKDFTTVLTMHHDARGEILAQLREIFGAYKKEFGNGKVVDWTGRVGLIAGVTPVVDTYSSVHQVLGERFVLYRLAPADGKAVARRAMSQRGTGWPRPMVHWCPQPHRGPDGNMLRPSCVSCSPRRGHGRMPRPRCSRAPRHECPPATRPSVHGWCGVQRFAAGSRCPTVAGTPRSRVGEPG